MDQGSVVLGAYADDHLGGFLFAKREAPDHFHIWLAGVFPEMRRQGLLRSLLTAMEAAAHEEGVTKLTINTYAKRFPVMFQALPNFGFHLDRTEEQEVSGQMLEKSFFSKTIEKK
jgi:GNAT superfamily N-acetyltransferase